MSTVGFNKIRAVPPFDVAILKLLANHYGDGSIYFREQFERKLYAQAMSMGVVSADGLLTAAGRSAVARYRGE